MCKTKQICYLQASHVTRRLRKNILPVSQICRWYKTFQDGRKYNDDEQRDGCPLSSWSSDSVAKILWILVSDCHMSIWMFSKMLRLTKSICFKLSWKNFKCGKFVSSRIFKLTQFHPNHIVAIPPQPLVKIRLRSYGFDNLENMQTNVTSVQNSILIKDF